MKSKNIYLYVILFLIIFLSQDTLLFGTNEINSFILIPKIFSIIFLIIYLLNILIFNIQLNTKQLMLSLILVLSTLITCFITEEEFFTYFYICLLIFDAMLFAQTVEKKVFLKISENIIYLLTIISLLFWGVGYLFPQLLSFFPITTNSLGYKFYTIIFANIQADQVGEVIRNTGIFREPGVYIIFLFFALYYQLFINDKIKLVKIIIFSLGIFTSFSTTGIICYVLLICIYFFKKSLNKDNKKIKSNLVLIFFIGIIILLLFTDYLSSESIFFSKFTKGTNSYGSWMARLNSVFTNLYIFILNPVFGYGRYALFADFSTFSLKVSEYQIVDNTNTLLFNFAAQGVFFGTIILIGFITFFINEKNNLLIRLFILLTFGIIFSCEILVYNMFFYIVVLYGLKGKEKIKNPKMYKNEKIKSIELHRN